MSLRALASWEKYFCFDTAYNLLSNNFVNCGMNETNFKNKLYTNDNLFILNGMNSNFVDLIYLAPPFNSKRTYSAPVGSKAAGTSFKDMWTWDDVNEAYLEKLAEDYPALEDFINTVSIVHSSAMSAYLTYMTQRIIQMHRVLKDTGSLYLHCDQTASHYLKIVLDNIFGKNNFRNEIVWCYTGPSGAKKNFPAKHDVILRYSKTEDYVFNPSDILIPYSDATLGRREYAETKQKGIKFKGKEYTEYLKGKIPPDWWCDIPSGGQISRKERTGYRTQKPLKLLNRIIEASTNEGDIVLDPFCGCATTCVAAEQLDRKWIGIDIEKQAVGLLMERLGDASGVFDNFINETIPPKRSDVTIVEPTKKEVRERLYKEQERICNGCGNEYLLKDLTTDHIVPVVMGGGSYYENYQLLCANCNSIKSKYPMEYLRMKINARKSKMLTKIVFGR